MILTTEQVAQALHIERHRLGMLRRYGLIHAVKLGRGYGYRPQEIERFLEWAEGKNLGTIDHIKFWAKNKGIPTTDNDTDPHISGFDKPSSL